VKDSLILALDGIDTDPFRIKPGEVTGQIYYDLTAKQGTGISEAWGRTARVATQNPKDGHFLLINEFQHLIKT